MEREIEARRPAQSNSDGLSKTAKVFFGLNIVQVIAIGGIQSAMIAFGNFTFVSKGGLGPGRRVYMALFLLAVLYSCFLCLFAVKRQNFLEILAFVLQNYAYIIYSGIQVYHISFKEYEDHNIERQTVLVYLTIIDSIGLLVLNIIFTYLANKLFCEYGWKIYKRVRFNIRLRAAFHLYETVLMLLKMQFLFITMFAICLNQTLLYDQVESFSYIASIASIPVCLAFTFIGIASIRRENKYMACFFILGVLAAIVYFVFKIASVATSSCSSCGEKAVVRDIPGEVNMHLLYLGSVNLILLVGLFVAAIKAVRNFGVGLAEHFKSDRDSKFIVLNLSKNLLTSIVTSSGEEQPCPFDLDTPRPSMSNGPRPSVFQHLSKFIGSSDPSVEDLDYGKSQSLPAHLQKRDNIAKQLGKSAKRRISQIFWENELGRYGSHRSSLASSHYSSCFRGCCLSLRRRQSSFSVYSAPGDKHTNYEFGQQNVSAYPNNNDGNFSKVMSREKTRRRKRSRSMGDSSSFSGSALSRRRLARVNSLPGGYMRTSLDDDSTTQNCFGESQSSTVRPSCWSSNCSTETQPMPEIVITLSHEDTESGGLLNEGAAVNPAFEKQDGCGIEEKESFVKKPPVRPILQRHAQSSIPRLSSMKMSESEVGQEDKQFQRVKHSSNKYPQEARKWIDGISIESSDGLRRALSDNDLRKNSGKRGRVHFAY